MLMKDKLLVSLKALVAAHASGDDAVIASATIEAEEVIREAEAIKEVKMKAVEVSR